MLVRCAAQAKAANSLMAFVLCMTELCVVQSLTQWSCGTVPASSESRTPLILMVAGESSEQMPSNEIPKVPCRIGGGMQGDWRVERARLVEKERQRIVRRKPRFGSFAQSSAYAQTLGLRTRDEWFEWLEMGEKSNPYCPSDPEGYYRKRREWLGWRCWLTGDPM